MISRQSKQSRGLRQAVLALCGFATSGCPVFSSNEGCWYDGDCAPGFVCNPSDGVCVKEPVIEPEPCDAPQDCRDGETCGPEGLCLPGDCTFSGCVSGFECGVEEGRWTCIAAGAGGAAGEAGAAGSASD